MSSEEDVDFGADSNTAGAGVDSDDDGAGGIVSEGAGAGVAADRPVEYAAAGVEEAKDGDASPHSVFRDAGLAGDLHITVGAREPFSLTYKAGAATLDAVLATVSRDASGVLPTVAATDVAAAVATGKVPLPRDLAESAPIGKRVIHSKEDAAAYVDAWVAACALRSGEEVSPETTWRLCMWCTTAWSVFRVATDVDAGTRILVAGCVATVADRLRDHWSHAVIEAVRAMVVMQRHALGSIVSPVAPPRPSADRVADANRALGTVLAMLAAHDAMTAAGLWQGGRPAGVLPNFWTLDGAVHARRDRVVFAPLAEAADALAVAWKPAPTPFPTVALRRAGVAKALDAANAVANKGYVRPFVLGVWTSRAVHIRARRGVSVPLLETVFVSGQAAAVAAERGAVDATHALVATTVLGSAAVAIPGTDAHTRYLTAVLEWGCGFSPEQPFVESPPTTRVARALATAVHAGVIRAGNDDDLEGLAFAYPGDWADDTTALWTAVRANVDALATLSQSADVHVFAPGVVPSADTPPLATVKRVEGTDAGAGAGAGTDTDGCCFVTPAFLPVVGTRVWVTHKASGAVAKLALLKDLSTRSAGTLLGVMATPHGGNKPMSADVVHVSAVDVGRNAHVPAIVDGALVDDGLGHAAFKGHTAVMLRVRFE